MRGDPENGEAEHTITWRDVCDTRAHGLNNAANFVAKNTRIRSIARIKCQRLEHVAEIHSRHFDFDQHLGRAALRQFKWSEVERVQTTALAGF